MAIERFVQLALVPLLFNRHAEDIRGALKEGDILFVKLAF